MQIVDQSHCTGPEEMHALVGPTKCRRPRTASNRISTELAPGMQLDLVWCTNTPYNVCVYGQF